MPIINIQVRRKKAASPVAHIVCGNSDYKISFNFDEEWDAYERKTARFIYNGQFADVVFTGDVCDVPVIQNATMCAVGVFAGDLRTTTPALITCDKSILCGGGSPAEPSPDVYAQIMALFTEVSVDLNETDEGVEINVNDRGVQRSAMVKHGETGPQGPVGPAPVRGEDYWTADDQAQVVTDVLAKYTDLGQLKPEYANSLAELEENGDTTKLYVLPDGYVYAYMTKYGAQHTNLIPTAIDSDGTPYNDGKGYKMGWKLHSGGDEQQNDYSANSLLTGFIPYNPATTKKIRICGYPNAEVATDDWVHFYDASFAVIENQQTALWPLNYGQTIEKEAAFEQEVSTFTFDLDTFTEASSWYGGEIASKAAYIRVSIQNAVEACAVITFDEEISFVPTTAWQSTGHAFVPADYEDRIVALEETEESHEERIKALELYGSDSTSAEDIPAYIKAEADGVIARLKELQGDRCFTVVGISDFHYGGTGDNKDNLIRACKAINYIQGRIHVDAVATLGDNIPHGESTESTLASGHRWFKEINEILRMTEGEGIAMFRTPGNHDRMGGNDSDGNATEPIPDNAIFAYIGGYNRGCILGDVPGGWGYQDFESYKLRVIVLNTSEVEGRGRFSEYSGFHMSTKQYNWLIDTLDMSDKADATDWQILVLSHHRADDYAESVDGGYMLPNILHAYRTGGSFSATRTEDGATISCDFAGKNQAGLIGNIHGHHHAYIYGSLYLGPQESGDQTDIVAISTPTSAFGSGEGHNDDNEGNWYDSVKDTAEETAFCVYSIDLDNHVVQAIHYGNGIDREIAYSIPDDRAENIPTTETWVFELEDGSTVTKQVVVK